MTPRLRRMRTTLRGPVRLPVGVLAAVVCVAVAAVYALALPPTVPRDAGAAEVIVLRWAHPAVWVVLAGACLAYAVRADHAVRVRFAAVALAVFLVFVLVLTFA